MYVYMYVFMCICIYVYMYVCTYVYMYICIYVYNYVHIYVYMCICTSVCMYVCIYVYVHMCICMGKERGEARVKKKLPKDMNFYERSHVTHRFWLIRGRCMHHFIILSHIPSNIRNRRRKNSKSQTLRIHCCNATQQCFPFVA